ncbi:MAG: 50S ribosomal protein L37ae [Candidatus Micrarchaeota archaeon]
MVKKAVRSGAEMRKRVKKIEKLKSSFHECPTCGKKKVKRVSNSIWKCKSCKSVYAGGTYSLKTSVGSMGRRIVEIKTQKR